MRNRISVAATALLFVLLALPATLFANELVSTQVHVMVNLTRAGSTDMAMSVLTREGPPAGETVLIVPGFAQTAATFDALAQALFRPEMGNKISRVIVLDNPGHGHSGYPAALPFGALLLEDYADALIKTMAALDARGMKPTVLMGHSVGGIIVEIAQQQLQSVGGSLRNTFDIRTAVLLAPDIGAPLPWLVADSGAAAQILGPLLDMSTLVITIPKDNWVNLFYTTPTGEKPTGIPTPDDAETRGYISTESGFLGLEVIGFQPFFATRPVIHPGIFGPNSGTTAGVVAMSLDGLFRPDEERAVYTFLTGDDKLKLFYLVDQADAVHNMHTFNPAPLLHPIKKILNASQ